MNESRPLCHSLADYGLSAVADELAALATRPGTKPLTHVEHAERHLRGWRRGEPERLEHAIARLLWCALLLRLNQEAHREEIRIER